MNMNVRGIQRNMKNVVKNYSDAQVKVREATSNDPWGPSSTLMSEIADLTYNVVAFSEIMQMIWKRLNDHGKNWRHVYKALVLLEYLIKTGSEKVAQQCKENIFAIQTLKDFQYIEENKDQGMNVREKSKTLVALLKDDEKLRNERARALKAKERFAQSVSYAGDPHSESIPKTSLSYHDSLGEAKVSNELESARPTTVGEEELQLQLALAMSKEEAEAEEKLRRNDDIRLQMAISESQKRAAEAKKTSAVDDLLSLNTSLGGAAAADPWGAPLNGSSASMGAVGGISPLPLDPWSSSVAEPVAISPVSDPWNPTPARSSSATNDPWQPSPPPNSTNNQPVNDAWMSIDAKTGLDPSPVLGASGGASASPETTSTQIRKTPESFLGPNSNLVNLDALVSAKSSSMAPGGNPFGNPTIGVSNPFQAAKPAAPTINQLRSQGSFPTQGSPSSGLGFTPFASSSSSSLLGASQGFAPSFVGPEAHVSTNFTSNGSNNPFSM